MWAVFTFWTKCSYANRTDLRLWGSLSCAEKLRNTEKETKQFTLAEIYVLDSQENYQSFPKELFSLYLFLPPPDQSILQIQVVRKRISLMDSQQKSGFILWVFPSSHSPFFPPVLHMLPVLMTTQTLLSRTSHSAWDNSHVLTRQTFVCGWF